jgi:hypothetical protein
MRQGSHRPALRPTGAQGSSLEAALERHASTRSRLAELLILCARIGFNP